MVAASLFICSYHLSRDCCKKILRCKLSLLAYTCKWIQSVFISGGLKVLKTLTSVFVLKPSATSSVFDYMLILSLIIAAGAEERGDPNDPRVRLKRDCVAILAAFRIIEAPSKLVILGNTHLYWQVLLQIKQQNASLSLFSSYCWLCL